MTGVVPVSSGPILIDTSAYFAATNCRDAGHELVAALMRDFVRGSRRLVTTNFVLAELHALLLTRVERRIAAQGPADIDASELTMVERVTADERQAREIVFGYADKDFSLTDVTSFAVMERLRIGQAFTLDRNFAQFGWISLNPPAGS